MSGWKAKSPPTENWDDDYLFQTIAPTASLPTTVRSPEQTHGRDWSHMRSNGGGDGTGGLPIILGAELNSNVGNGQAHGLGGQAIRPGANVRGENAGLGLGLAESEECEPPDGRGLLGTMQATDGESSTSGGSEELDWDAEDAGFGSGDGSAPLSGIALDDVSDTGAGLTVGKSPYPRKGLGTIRPSDATGIGGKDGSSTAAASPTTGSPPSSRVHGLSNPSSSSSPITPTSPSNHDRPSVDRKSFHAHRASASSSPRSLPPKVLSPRSDINRRDSYDGLGLEDRKREVTFIAESGAVTGTLTNRPKTASALGFFGSGKTRLEGSVKKDHKVSEEQINLEKGHRRTKSGHVRRTSQPFVMPSSSTGPVIVDSKPSTPVRTPSNISAGQTSSSGGKNSETGPGTGLGIGAAKAVKPKLMSRISSFHKRLSGSTAGLGSPTVTTPATPPLPSPSRGVRTSFIDGSGFGGLPSGGLGGSGSHQTEGSESNLVDMRQALEHSRYASPGLDPNRSEAQIPAQVFTGGLSSWSYPGLPSTNSGTVATGTSPPPVPRRSSSRSDLTTSPISTKGAPPVPPIPLAHRTSSRATDRSSISDISTGTQSRPLASASPSISLGFHLPSPNPGSPYYPANAGGFSQTKGYFGQEQEVTTPRRTKIRPVSHVPSTTRPATAGTSTFRRSESMQTLASSDRNLHVQPESAISAKGVYPWEAQIPSPVLEAHKVLSTATQDLSRSKSTLKRLSSMSKRHGRKISDGWRLASGSSAKSTDTVASPAMMTSAVMSSTQTEVRPSPLEERSRTLQLPSSASMPLAGLSPHHSTVPLRSLSQNDSPSASRTSSRAEDVMEDVTGSQRRNSLSDLRIPMTVAKAQAGLKRGLVAVKLFAEGIEDLKRLLDQREGLHQRGVELSEDKEDEEWWNMATLLIQLGENPIEEAGSGSTPPMQAMSDLKRDRRVTLAAGTSRTPVRKGKQEGSAGAVPPDAKLGPPMRNEAWRASTGRHDLTPSQLDALRQILSRPEGPTKSDDGEGDGQGIRISQGTRLPSGVAGATEGCGMMSPRLESRGSVSEQMTPSDKQQRRGSRSALSAFKEFIMPTSGNRSVASGDSESLTSGQSKAKYPPRSRHSKTQSRPSLAAVFRKNSSHFSPSTPHPLASSVSSPSSAAPSWRLEEDDAPGSTPTKQEARRNSQVSATAPGMLAVPRHAQLPSSSSGGSTWTGSTGDGTWSASSLLSLRRALRDGEQGELAGRRKPLLVTPDRLPVLTEQVEMVRGRLEDIIARANA